MRSLVINPGSTSTKLAVFTDKSPEWEKNINHEREKINSFSRIIEQLDWRLELCIGRLREAGYSQEDFDFVVARGGLLDPIPGGTYLVDEDMIADLKAGKNGEHASNLGAIMAKEISAEADIPAFIVDPVSVDEFEALARLSGLPELPRKCQSHALNLKAIGRKTAAALDKDFFALNQIGVHLGGGISIAALKKGRIVDVNNANQGGPYSPERTGTLPALDLTNYIFTEKPEAAEMKKKIVGKGGLTAYLGTADGRKIEKEIAAGNEKAELIYQGMIYQIAKEIGSMAAVLAGEVAAIFLTGGLANSDYVTEKLEEYVNFLAPVYIFPGTAEMEHLVGGGLRVLQQEEEAKVYAEVRG